MYKEFIHNYHKKLDNLYDKKVIDSQLLSHFKKRGIQIFDTNKDLKCFNLSKLLPYVTIGASDNFVNNMTIPYQSTSFIAADIDAQNKGVYAYKIPNVKGGGVPFLTGGIRKIGDNIFASLHRILIGCDAIVVTANNMMENHDQIWSWDFFGKNLRQEYPLIYEELDYLSQKFSKRDTSYFVISIRSLESVFKLNLIEYYQKGKVKMLNPENNIKVIIFTTSKIFEFISKIIKESDLISYLVLDDDFNIELGLKLLRKNNHIKYLLNDGGRIMSNSMRDNGLLGEERVTLEPFNSTLLKYIINDDCILGKNGLGLDGSELEFSFLLSSIQINDEKLNVYLYPLNENNIS